MQFQVRQAFPVGLDLLWGVLGRRAYTEAKYRALGSTQVRLLSFEADAALIEVELQREAAVAADRLPAWARVLAGRQQRMHHHSLWRRLDPHRAEVEFVVSAVGLHTTARGRGQVVQRPRGGARLELDFDARCTLPLRAKAVARLFARQVEAALEADHVFTLDYLARHGAGPARG